MPLHEGKRANLSDRDLDFIISTASPDASDKFRLKEIIWGDEDFRNTFIGDPRVLRRVMDDEEILLKISPRLFLKSCSEMQPASWRVSATQWREAER